MAYYLSATISKNIKYVVILFIFAFVSTQNTFAYEPNGHASRLDSMQKVKATNTWNKFCAFADKWSSKNIDTTYLALPKYRWRIALRGEVGAAHTSFDIDGLPHYGDVDARFNSHVTPKIGANIAFRNLNIGYMADLFKGYSNFGIGFIQNGWGLELLRRKTSYANGYVDASEIEGKTDIGADDISLTTLFVSGYLAFNRKKFSMPAAFKQSLIQKKSAGSVMAYVDFRYANLHFNKDGYMAMTGGLHDMEIYQIALGVGYGYNYTPNKGKVLLHISVIPMVSVFNQLLLTGDSRMFWHNEEENYNLVFTRKVSPRYPFFLTGMARAAVVWNINDRFVLALSGICHNIRYRMQDKMFEIDRDDLTLDYNVDINAHLMTWDWKADLIFGVRF